MEEALDDGSSLQEDGYEIRPRTPLPVVCEKVVGETVRLATEPKRRIVFAPCHSHHEAGTAALRIALSLRRPVIVVTQDYSKVVQGLMTASITERSTGRFVYPNRCAQILRSVSDLKEGDPRPSIAVSPPSGVQTFLSRLSPSGDVITLIDGRTIPRGSTSELLDSLGDGGTTILHAVTLRSPLDSVEVVNPTGQGVLLKEALHSASVIEVSDSFSSEAHRILHAMGEVAKRDIGFKSREWIRARNASAIACTALTPFEFGLATRLARAIRNEELRHLCDSLIEHAEDCLGEKREGLRSLSEENPETRVVLRDGYQIASVFGREAPPNLASLDSHEFLLEPGRCILCSVPREFPGLEEITTLRDFSLALRPVEREFLGRVLTEGSLVVPFDEEQTPSQVVLSVEHSDGKVVEHTFYASQTVIKSEGRIAHLVPAHAIKPGDTVAVPDPALYEALFRKVARILEENDERLSMARKTVRTWKQRALDVFSTEFGDHSEGLAELESAMKEQGARVVAPHQIRRWMEVDVDEAILAAQKKDDIESLARVLGDENLLGGVDDYYASVRRLRGHRRELGQDLRRKLAKMLPRGLADTPEGRELLQNTPIATVIRKEVFA